MMKKNTSQIENRIKKLFPHLTDEEASEVAEKHRAYIRRGFNVSRLGRVFFVLTLFVICGVACGMLFYWLMPESFKGYSTYFMMISAYLVMRPGAKREEEALLKELVADYLTEEDKASKVAHTNPLPAQ